MKFMPPIQNIIYIMAWPEPNNIYVTHPKALITAISEKTIAQLCVTCKIYPEKYTPRKPEKRRITLFIYIIGYID